MANFKSPAIFYSFSFCPNPDWKSFCPGGPEIVEYLQGVCEKYQIVDKIQLNSDVVEARWLESEQVWELTICHLVFGFGDLSSSDRTLKVQAAGLQSPYTHEEKVRCKILVSGVGGLVEPKPFPEGIPGQERFQGQIFHSARWNYDVDLKDKNIVVVGTGASATQFVPELIPRYSAKSVTQLMRSPPWVLPRSTPPLGHEGWDQWSPWLAKNVPGYGKLTRFVIFSIIETDWLLFGTGPNNERARKKLEEKLLEYIRTTPKKYHEILTPNYVVGCKRRIFDVKWFDSLKDPNIELTTLPLTSVAEKTVTLGPGRTYPPPRAGENIPSDSQLEIPADVIILANGFDTTAWFHPLQVYGRGGKQLHDVFAERGGPQMYMGLVMDGFPNFFTLWGPNTITGHSSAILAIENMVNLSLKFVKPILNGEVVRTEIKKKAEIEWAEDIQRASKKLIWYTPNCRSWYVNVSA